MGRFRIGQVVKLNVGDHDLGIILSECSDPVNHWCVALRNKIGDRTRIMRISEQELKPYISFCWSCGERDLNSDIHPTCSRCGWIVCPECKSCEKDICGSNQLVVLTKTGYWELSNLERFIFEEEMI